MVAGTPCTVASLWKVSDDSACDFMHYLYKYWLEDGLTLRVAAQRARCSMIQQKHELLPGPAYVPAQWAPFILVGIATLALPGNRSEGALANSQ